MSDVLPVLTGRVPAAIDTQAVAHAAIEAAFVLIHEQFRAAGYFPTGDVAPIPAALATNLAGTVKPLTDRPVDGQVVLSQAFDDHWRATASKSDARHRESFGWANQFEPTVGTTAYAETRLPSPAPASPIPATRPEARAASALREPEAPAANAAVAPTSKAAGN